MKKQTIRIPSSKSASAGLPSYKGFWTTVSFIAALSVLAPATHADAVSKKGFAFVNIVDTTQGFVSFGSAPAINNSGTVAFEAAGTEFSTGSVWKWQNGDLALIATSAGDVFHNFGDNVVINSFGTVGFNARVPETHDTIIATSDGGPLNIVASANEDGLIGGGALGLSAMNDSGTVVFPAFRRDTLTQAIFVGNGGPLQVVVDTVSDGFSALGNSDISVAGKIVFTGFPPDGTEGLFVRKGGISDVLNTNDPRYLGFIDPVMNDAGTVGIGAFLSSGGSQVLTANGRKLTPRTDPETQTFLSVDNVCINNSGDVAFTGETPDGVGIFVELTGGANPVTVIGSGDSLFGSTVVNLTNGRFSLNKRREIVFHYQLADGRSGLAIASPRACH